MTDQSLAAGFGWPGRSLVVIFGLLPAGLITIVAIFLLPNIQMLHSDASASLPLSTQLRHYLTFSAPIPGFVAMLFAFVAPAAERQRFFRLALAGLVIGVVASGIGFVLLTQDLWFFLGHWIRGTRLPFDFVQKRLLGTAIWFVVFGGMITVGITLARRLVHERRASE